MTMWLLFMIPPALLSLWASMRVKTAFNHYSRVPSERGLTGAQAAQILLDQAGIHDVEIVPTNGFLSDHYDPSAKRLALSEATYASTSIAAIGVATHEAGHAIQHATNYGPLGLRSALVPTAGIGSNLSYIIIMAGFLMHSAGLVLTGAVVFSAVFLFQLVTLPVEFDASRRAKELVVASGIIRPDEREGVDAVLNAAAMTYVAAAVTSLMTLIYYVLQALAMGNRNRD